MTRDKNRQFRLEQRPTGRAKATDFDFVESPVPTPGAGEALIRTLYLSIDAAIDGVTMGQEPHRLIR
jgi:NADPH-dependent curcumin reductase CurA